MKTLQREEKGGNEEERTRKVTRLKMWSREERKRETCVKGDYSGRDGEKCETEEK